MENQKLIKVFLTFFLICMFMLPVSAIASSGGIDYGDSELVDSNAPNSKQESSRPNEDNGSWLPNWLESTIGRTKKTILNTWNGTKEVATDGFDLIKDKTNESIEWIGDKLQGVGEWWNERSLLEKSLMILGAGATILTGGVALGVISAGAAVIAGISGAASYGLYAMNTDQVSLAGGLGMMTLGAFGGIGIGALRGVGMLGARGSSLITAASKGISSSRMGRAIGALGQTRVGAAILSGTRAAIRVARPVLSVISSKGALTGAAISSLFAGGTHVYNTMVNGEPLDSKAMINDMVVWGAAGAIGVGLASKTFQGIGTFTKSKVLKTASSATVGGTSEYALGNLFQGKSPGIKKTLMVAGLSLALGGAVVLGPVLTNVGKQGDGVGTVANKNDLMTTNNEANDVLIRPSSRLRMDLQYFSNNTHQRNTWNEFQSHHKNVFINSTQASSAYKELIARQSPWPHQYEPIKTTLKPGTRFEMALGSGQPVNRPGGFGTFNKIDDTRFVREILAVKESWKPDLSKVVTYEVIEELPVNKGRVGPQIDENTNKYLPGGGTQVEMLVSPKDRMKYLKVVDERTINE
ncbi:hypothetical protein [Alkalihalobacillus sp. CinArs1]|uniref:hypothetical protein n=1 Tax=Alkalihalobacillus sp. CinArs1 TaxID=2995314 RepID=UPI0022DE1317|nr:hypothetical protein [Alkalihalobacillus sp. CinArs1]